MEKVLENNCKNKYMKAFELIYDSKNSFVEEVDEEIFDKYGNYVFPTESNLLSPNKISGMIDYII